MGITSLCFNVIITSLVMIQQKLSRVCRRTNNYFVVLSCVSVSSFLLQDSESIHTVRNSQHMGCFLDKESNNGDSLHTELLNAMCNLAYRKNITKTA